MVRVSKYTTLNQKLLLKYADSHDHNDNSVFRGSHMKLKHVHDLSPYAIPDSVTATEQSISKFRR
jgi:hypothetical protein